MINYIWFIFFFYFDCLSNDIFQKLWKLADNISQNFNGKKTFSERQNFRLNSSFQMRSK